jgi:hypothetical protein
VTRGFAAAVMATVLLVGASAVWAAPNAVTLEMKGEPGQEMRYSTTFSMSLDLNVEDPESGNQVFSLAPRAAGSAVTVSRVADVSENGDLSLAGRVESFDFSLDVADLHARLAIVGPDGGAPQLIKLPEIPIRTVMSKAGKLVAIEGLEKLPIPPIPAGPDGRTIDLKGMMSKMTSQFSQPLFPDRPVSVGDTWEWEMVIEPLKMAEMMGTPMPPEAKEQLGALSFPIKSTSTLVGFEMVKGVECAKIEAVAPWELNMPAGPGGMVLDESVNTKVVTWFDYAAGQTVKESTQVEVMMTVGNEQATPVRMEMRISGESELQ